MKNNRSEFIQSNKNDIILDAYNANPTSMSMGIKNFIEINPFLKYKSKLFILGDMLELGQNEVNYHQEIVDLLVKNNVKKCILIGSIFHQTICQKNYIKVNSVSECEAIIKEKLIKQTSIFIKGSRKLSLEKLINHL